MVVGDMDMKVDLLVIGAGPGGYAAAFRAADLGLEVALVDPRDQPGGVCLHEGCIPSKTCLYLAELIEEARGVKKLGVHFQEPEIEIEEIRAWKNQVVGTMAQGLVSLSDKRSILRFPAKAHFESSDTVRLEGGEISRIRFKYAVIASGSRPVAFPGTSFKPGGRIMNSTGALALPEIPDKLLVVGGGYVGLELGYLYAALGSRVRLIEVQDRLLGGVDPDLVEPLQRKLTEMFDRIDLQAKILSLEETETEVKVQLETSEGEATESYDRVLVAMGRKPRSDGLGLENTSVVRDERGFIQTDEAQRTAADNIFAVGDVCGGMMLAHTAIRQGRVAAEAAAGLTTAYDVRAVPAVVYTDPQVGWCGLTEEQAGARGLEVDILRFPWRYSGRAQSMGAGDGLTKIIVEKESGRILGLGMCGRDVEGLLGEGVLAIEMGAVAEDLALSVHPHPTLSETIGEAAEIFLGSPTHLLPGKKG